jgi:hypothetical protein
VATRGNLPQWLPFQKVSATLQPPKGLNRPGKHNLRTATPGPFQPIQLQELAMNAKLNLASPSSTVTFATAALATVIAMGILWAVVTLFQSRGAPLERLAAAERACAQHAYQSERAACMTEWLAASQPRTIARR